MRELLILIAVVIVGGSMIGALISQRGTAPGLKVGKLSPVGSRPNAVCSEPDTPSDVHVAPLTATLAEAKAAVEKTGGTIVTDAEGYIAATYTTRLARFVDDVELRDEGNGTVHIRSASRVGHSDMGANRKRVERIRRTLEATKTV